MKDKKLKITDYNGSLGNVNISIIHNDKVMRKINTHNNGTVAICNYLRDAIAGDYVIADRPGIIVPCSGDAYTLVDIGQGTPLFNDLPKKSTSDDDLKLKSSSCTLSFLIPSNILSPSVPIAGFRLYSKQTKTLFAEVNLISADVGAIEVTSGDNIKVEWTLIVKLVSTKEGD